VDGCIIVAGEFLINPVLSNVRLIFLATIIGIHTQYCVRAKAADYGFRDNDESPALSCDEITGKLSTKQLVHGKLRCEFKVHGN
jgi:hypothetical protein